MTFLPDGTLLVTEKRGVLWHVTPTDRKQKCRACGKSPMAVKAAWAMWCCILILNAIPGSICLMPNARMITPPSVRWWSAQSSILKNSPLKLASVQKLWVQEPKVTGKGHYSHRIAFGPDGKMFITSGDRQKLTPAQNFDGHLGKVLRLNDDGTVPDDNPWQDRGEIARQFWTVGHRNMLGIDFDADGRLWVHEMGPRHGDELNLIIAGKNYGWPIVSNGDHYSGIPIPDHDTRPEFEAPADVLGALHCTVRSCYL
jgi:hypothetical protein